MKNKLIKSVKYLQNTLFINGNLRFCQYVKKKCSVCPNSSKYTDIFNNNHTTQRFSQGLNRPIAYELLKVGFLK